MAVMRTALVALLTAVVTIPALAQPRLVFYKPKRCGGNCAKFEQVLAHPAIQRRLAAIDFATEVNGKETTTARHVEGGVEVNVAYKYLPASLAYFDKAGTLRARWTELPRDTGALGTLLDGVVAAAPYFDRALTNIREAADAEIDIATGLSKLGKPAEARAAIERALAGGTPHIKQYAAVTAAMLDVNEGKREQGLAALDRLIESALTPDIAAHAWMAIGETHRDAGATAQAVDAFDAAARIAGHGTDVHAEARQALAALQTVVATAANPIRLVMANAQIVSGRQTVRTSVASADVASVAFTIDGADARTITKPPFATTFDFGRMPQARRVRAVAFDQGGRELGRDELIVNEAGETFWLRLVEPRQGPATGNVRVGTTMRTPAGRNVRRVKISWNDAERAVLTAPPWNASVTIPNETGVLGAVAELDDGRTTEDAVLLNAGGLVDNADVQLVELPLIVADGELPAAQDVVIREGSMRRTTETILTGIDAPLTIGMVVDTSASMQAALADVQEAAIRFLDATLTERDRGFLVTFDSAARLTQPPTADRALLRKQVLGIHAAGSTALHDAMILGLLQFEGVKGRRAMVVFSDGADVVSRYKSHDVAELARRSNIPIYFIAAQSDLSGSPPAMTHASPTPGTVMTLPGPPKTDANMRGARAFSELTQAAESTGGRVHRLMKLEDLPAVYRAIETDLRAQVLAVVRTDRGRHENDWRAIEVELAGRKGVRAPAGYYAPW
jgi:VWFA-related protein